MFVGRGHSGRVHDLRLHAQSGRETIATVSGYGRKSRTWPQSRFGPQTTGISLAFGQTTQISSPQAKTCQGTDASVTSYSYGTTNNQLVDISPTGSICAGTWNRNTGGGIANYTICNFPNPLPSTGGLPYGDAYITASADSVTSNPVEVFVHPQVTSMSLVLRHVRRPQNCTSQTQTAQLDAQACFVGASNQQQLLCAPSTASAPYACLPAPACSGASIPDLLRRARHTLVRPRNASRLNQPGHKRDNRRASRHDCRHRLSRRRHPRPVTSPSARRRPSTSRWPTVPLPGPLLRASSRTSLPPSPIPTAIQSPVSRSTTNPPTRSTSRLPRAEASAPLSPASPPSTPSASQAPAILRRSIEIGLYGTGLPISSNPVTVTTPGTASDFVWFGSPGQSQYFEPIELLTGTVGATVRLPYVPNSMVMDKGANSLYFGSAHELMVYAAFSNTLTRQDPNAPGVVLAVSPTTTICSSMIRLAIFSPST